MCDIIKPLSERLTDEERAYYRGLYQQLLSDQQKARRDGDTFYGNILSAQRGMLTLIFGEDLFK